MENFLEGIDVSGLGEKGKMIASLLVEGAKATFATIKAESGAIADSAKKTVAIGNKALKEVIAGKLDSAAALSIVRRSAEQLEDLARAEANLVLSASVAFLKKIGESVISLIPGLFKP